MFLKLWSTRLNQSIYKPCGFRSFRPLRKRSMSMPSVLRSSTPACPKHISPRKIYVSRPFARQMRNWAIRDNTGLERQPGFA